MERFTRDTAVSRFREYLEVHRQKGMLDFEEAPSPRADFIINISPHLRPGIDRLNDLPVKISNCVVKRREVARHAENGVCLLVLLPSDDEKRITQKFIEAQIDSSKGREKFGERIRKTIINEASSGIKCRPRFSFLRKTIKKLTSSL